MTPESSPDCEDEELYRVERILAERQEFDETTYLVKWEGYPDEQCTWEPKDNFSEMQTIIDWENQRNKGDFLDEEEVAAVQKRMDAFQARQDAAEAAQEEQAARLQASRPTNATDISSVPEPSNDVLASHPPRPSRKSKSSTPETDLVLATRKRKGQTKSPSDIDLPPASKRLKHGETSKLAYAPTIGMPQPAGFPQPSVMRQAANPHPPDPSAKEVRLPNRNPNLNSTKGVPSQAIASSSTNRSNQDIHVTKPKPQASLPTSHADPPQTTKLKTSTTDKDVSESVSAPIANSAAAKAIGPARHSQGRAGQRFNSLRHQNNYMKLSRQEGVPDPKALDLRSPEEWSNPKTANNIAVAQPQDQNAGWSLFVPEEGDQDPLESTVENAVGASIVKESSLSTDVLASDLQPAPTNVLDSPSTTGVEQPTPEQVESMSNLDQDTNNGALPTTSSTVAAKEQIENRSEVALIPSSIPSSVPAPQPPQPARSTTQFQSLSATNNTKPHTGSYEAYPRGLVKTLTGRVFDPRQELLVQLYLGVSPVGDVKIRSFPPWLKTKIMGLKSIEGKLGIAFEENCFQQPDEYAAFSQQLDPRSAAAGTVVAYQDTMQSMDSLIQHLEKYNVCAIWVYPDDRETLVMILYSCGAPGWKSFNQQLCLISDQHLHLSVRNSFYHLYRRPGHAVRRDSHNQSFVPHDPQEHPLRPVVPPQDLDMAPARARLDRTQTTPVLGSSSLGAAESATQLTRRKSFTAQERPRPWSSKSHDGSIGTHKAPGPGSNPVARREYDGTESAELVGVPSTNSRKISLTEIGENGESVHAGVYAPLTKEDFDYMTTIGPGLRGDSSKFKVFVTFTETHPSEARMVQEWLRHYVKPRNLYSDAVKTDWNDFLGSFDDRGTALSIVLFPSELPNYVHYNKLGSFLKTETFLCFNMDLEPSANGERKSPLARRLFPRGTVLCITEGCMTYYPKEALSALEFFERGAAGKAANWTLILIPDIIPWLTKRLAQTTEGENRTILDMLGLVSRLRSKPFIQALSVDKNDFDRLAHLADDEADALVLEVPRLPGYVPASETRDTDREAALRARDKVISEYFIGWTANKASSYRHIILIDDNMTNKTEKFSGHVNIVDPVKFVRQFSMHQFPDKGREKA